MDCEIDECGIQLFGSRSNALSLVCQDRQFVVMRSSRNYRNSSACVFGCQRTFRQPVAGRNIIRNAPIQVAVKDIQVPWMARMLKSGQVEEFSCH